MEMRIRPVSGFTLIELILALTLVAILVAVALPSYRSLRQEQMVRAATQAIYTDVMLLKSEAVKRNSNLTLIIFNSGLSGWCYRVAVDGAGTCNSCADSCSSVEGRKGGDASEYPGLTLTASYTGGKLTFSPRRGTLAAGNIELSSDTYNLRVVSNNVGRVSTCAPTGSKVGGVPSCS
ncbi:GspH/FimT family pseudopilin [Aeromonas taiwanensis]|uniref:GspH/FimT family pseudopilin n=1 Tax=Aeromonas TaxID=642 RepID=UPI001B33B85A|nr:MULTISPECIES: GspH/FimT family pseudopilin [Aeromonas]MBP4041879.1 GspH/FimT family pseudopilin [Aeromonas sp. SrichE-2G]MDX7764750.1 GspH/FimT family pseudopilin [Aeromonas caviae]